MIRMVSKATISPCTGLRKLAAGYYRASPMCASQKSHGDSLWRICGNCIQFYGAYRRKELWAADPEDGDVDRRSSTILQRSYAMEWCWSSIFCRDI